MRKVIFLLPVLAGCTATPEQADKIATGVIAYCFQPPVVRAETRRAVNDLLDGYGHTIRVECHGDAL